jgi:hypothetical protein
MRSAQYSRAIRGGYVFWWLGKCGTYSSYIDLTAFEIHRSRVFHYSKSFNPVAE